MQNKPLSGAPPKWDCSDLPVIKAHPGPDPRDERKKMRELGGAAVT